MTKKGKNKNLNMFVRNNGKEEHVHVLYPLLYVAKIVLEIRVCRTCIFARASNKKFIVPDTTLGP
jgi:hypothetical protein